MHAVHECVSALDARITAPLPASTMKVRSSYGEGTFHGTKKKDAQSHAARATETPGTCIGPGGRTRADRDDTRTCSAARIRGAFHVGGRAERKRHRTDALASSSLAGSGIRPDRRTRHGAAVAPERKRAGADAGPVRLLSRGRACRTPRGAAGRAGIASNWWKRPISSRRSRCRRSTTMTAAPEEPPPATPDFSARQIYLDAAPSGIDARWAWTQSGGRGTRHPHHRRRGELALHARGSDPEPGRRRRRARRSRASTGATTAPRCSASSAATCNAIGITGIAADAIVSAVAHGGIGSAAAINQAATRLARGRRHPARDAPARAALQLRSRATTSSATSPSSGGRTTSPRSSMPPAAASSWSKPRATAPRTSTTRSIRRARPGFPAGWTQSVPPGQPRLGRHRRRRRRAAAGHARPRLGPGPLAPRLLQLGRAHRRAGLGPRGHHLRLRRSAGRHQRGPLVHGHLQRHVERVADRHRRDRLPPGHGQGARAPGADAGAGAQLPALDRIAAAGRAGTSGNAAHRQPPRSSRTSRPRIRQGQGARQGNHQGDEGDLQGYEGQQGQQRAQGGRQGTG